MTADVEKKFVPRIVITTLDAVLTSAPTGQIADTVGFPAETFRVTGTAMLLLDAVVEATTILSL